MQEEEEVGMSAKELEEAKKAAKELQARNVRVKYKIWLYLFRCVAGWYCAVSLHDSHSYNHMSGGCD